MTAPQYIGWALHDLVGYGKFRPLKTELPDLWGQARVFDAAVVTNRVGRFSLASLAVIALVVGIVNAHRLFGLEGGGYTLAFPVTVALFLLTTIAGFALFSTAAVVIVFKAADDLSFTQLMGELEALERLIPSPGSVDAFEYYGGLVLVFEKPVPSAKRDRLIGMRRSSPLGRKVTDIYVVELDAGTMYSVDVPWNIKKFLPFLNGAFSHKGDAPAWAPPEPGAGQRTSRTDVAIVTLGLIAVMTAIHAGLFTECAETENMRLFRAGAAHSEMHGQWWRTIAPMYLHANWSHLIGNMVALLEFGRGVEGLFGAGWMMALFVATGVCGEWMTWFMEAHGIGIGASGAVFGMAGVLAAVYLFRHQRLSIRYRSHVFVGGAFAALQLLEGLSNPVSGINNWAHLGGFVGGFAIGVVLPFRPEGGPSPWRGAWWGTAALALSAWSAVLVGINWDWTPADYAPQRSEELRVVLDRPEGWAAMEGGSPRQTVVTDLFGGAVAVMRVPQRIGGMFSMPLAELKRTIEDDIGKDQEAEGGGVGRSWRHPYEGKVRLRMTDFEVAQIPLAGGRAIQVKYVLRLEGKVLHYFLIPESIREEVRREQIYLPLEDAFLLVQIEYMPQDAEYYRPIIARIKNGMKSLDKPFDWIAPQGGH
ncbi:MAG: rhomboid family intramembrane serine protease [Candidatus Coatesbacteria bacterium]